MKKTIKTIFSLTLTLVLLFGISTTVFAWNKPTIKEDYVQPNEEFRAVWVCTVSNMDIDRQLGTDEDAINAWKEKYMKILNSSKDLGMNAIIFQVSPCNDAFYPSKYKPWSENLAGFGVNPGWDPVEWMIEVTHAAGLEYHAWFNPYRTSVTGLNKNITKVDQSTNNPYIYNYDEVETNNYKQEYFAHQKEICQKNNNVVDNPIFASGESLNHNVLYGTEGKFILNPASDETIEHLKNTFTEFVTNYDADGVHFDDYFYPDDKNYKGNNTEYRKYTFSCEPSVDMADYNAYVEKGGNLSIYDWRRDNVNRLIKSLSDIVRELNKTKKTKCAFGISPAARWAPSKESCTSAPHRGAEGGMDASCNNYYSYSDLYADTKKWAVEGWLDYILPQVYTYLGSAHPSVGIPTGDYNKITKWWSDALKDVPCKLYIGTPLYQIDNWISSGKATSEEIYYQLRWNQYKDYKIQGYVIFRYESFFTKFGNKSMNKVNNELWTIPALTPTYDAYQYDSVKTNAKVNRVFKDSKGNFTIQFDEIENAKAYGLLEDGKLIKRVLKGTNEITFTKVEGKTYELVTYGYDNNVHKDKFTVDFTKLEENKTPVVTMPNPLKKEYLVSSKIDLSFLVTDEENNKMIYTLKFDEDGRERILVENQPVVNGKIEYTHQCYAVKSKNCKFILTIDDGYNILNYETTLFDVVKELTPEPEPDPDPVPPVDPVPTPDEEKKCGKKCGTLIVSMISIFSLISLILRKKD